MLACLFAATRGDAQSKQQQQTLERILADQKQWQQSKMPTQTYYNRNYYYKVPRFPDHFPNNGLSHYETTPVPTAEKTHLSYRVKYPQNSPVYKKDSVDKNKSFVKFTGHNNRF